MFSVVKQLREIRAEDLMKKCATRQHAIHEEANTRLKNIRDEQDIMLVEIAEREKAVKSEAEGQVKAEHMRTSQLVADDLHTSPIKHSKSLRHSG